MIRILLIFVVPFFVPTAVYVLWRTFAPVKWGGSEAIHRDDWEPLPWRYLMIVGGVLTAISVFVTILFPDVFGGGELANSPPPASTDR